MTMEDSYDMSDISRLW